MNKSALVSFVPLAALLLAGSVLAQTIPGPDAARSDRRCTSATLSTDPSTLCPDDVLNDRPGSSPTVLRPPATGTTGSGNTTGTTATVNPGPSTPGAAGAGGVSTRGAARR